MMSGGDALFDFPCTFPLKIMGEMRDGFADAVVGIVLRHVPDFDAAGVEMRASATGKYLSLTCLVNATSRPQLDALYHELTAHPWVKVVL